MYPDYLKTIKRKSKKEEKPNKERDKSEITNKDSKLTIESKNKQRKFVLTKHLASRITQCLQ